MANIREWAGEIKKHLNELCELQAEKTRLELQVSRLKFDAAKQAEALQERDAELQKARIEIERVQAGWQRARKANEALEKEKAKLIAATAQQEKEAAAQAKRMKQQGASSERRVKTLEGELQDAKKEVQVLQAQVKTERYKHEEARDECEYWRQLAQKWEGEKKKLEIVKAVRQQAEGQERVAAVHEEELRSKLEAKMLECEEERQSKKKIREERKRWQETAKKLEQELLSFKTVRAAQKSVIDDEVENGRRLAAELKRVEMEWKAAEDEVEKWRERADELQERLKEEEEHVDEVAIEEAVVEAVTAKTRECDEAFEDFYNDVAAKVHEVSANVEKTRSLHDAKNVVRAWVHGMYDCLDREEEEPVKVGCVRSVDAHWRDQVEAQRELQEEAEHKAWCEKH